MNRLAGQYLTASVFIGEGLGLGVFQVSLDIPEIIDSPIAMAMDFSGMQVFSLDGLAQWHGICLSGQ
jgi:hypothetical protein